jgi:hypothetical protein
VTDPQVTAKKQRGRPFKKGQSGNPSGRPKKTPELLEIEALCREKSTRAVERLGEWVESDNARASVAACQGILAQAFGTPKQRVEHTGKDGEPIRHQITEIRRSIVDPREGA